MSEPASRLVGYTDARLAYILPEIREVYDKLIDEFSSHRNEQLAEEVFEIYKQLQELHKRIQEG